MQKDFLHVLPVGEVISRLLDVSPLPQESKRLDKLSGGPILAETIMATETLPPANRSGLDGYAVQASDLFGASEANPVWLDCVGEIAIDRPPNFTLQSGQCAAIVTGGYLPEGADAVIMVEHTKGISLCVKKGERIAIVGENGSGKSTLLNLLAGFYRPQKGIIKLYGAPVELMDIQDMRNRIAVISQRPYLFQGTIEENVNIDGKASRDAVVEACRKSGALGFIEKLDHGFGQKIGQDGAKLSGGERQKIAVARALLKNADILLMDEATEGFDVESNEALRELLHSELKNKTIVFITHKYKELESVDKVYRLSKGILELVRS